MTRQSISLTELNDEWLISQIENGEYSSKNEAINDLIRRQRQRDEERTRIQHELITAERSGMTISTPDDIRTEIRKELGLNG